MKSVLMICLVIPSMALADSITTRQGQVYSDITVTRVEPDGITIRHDAGIIKLFFYELPQDIRDKYGADPVAAREYQRMSHQAQQNYLAAVQQAQQNELESSGQRIEQARQQQKERDEASRAAAQSTARPLGPPTMVQGTVHTVIHGEGLILSDVAFESKAKYDSTLQTMAGGTSPFFHSDGKQWQRSRTLIFVRTPTVGYTDGAAYKGRVQHDGEYRHFSDTYKAYRKL